MKIDDILELNIIDVDYQGLGIAKIDGFPIFVDDALCGEVVLAKIIRVTKNLAFAKNLRIIKKVSERNDNICPYFKDCGGCNIMHMNYETQLKYKTKVVKDTIKKVSGLTPLVNDCVKNDNIYGYRNKVIMPLGIKDGEIISGFYKEKSHDIVDIKSCMIEPNISKDIMSYIKELLKKYNVEIYNEELHEGIIRNVMLRIASSGDVMVVLVLLKEFKFLNSLVSELKDKFDCIKSIYININNKKTNVVLQEEYKLMYGDKYLIENINGLNFYVHPNSFLQINHSQCENMYKKAIEYANIKDTDTVIDAYCGIGSISLNIALKAKFVYGIEIVKEAIINANENMKLNNINNASFMCGPCEDLITSLVNKTKIDVIFFDPPRKGCDIKFLNTVINSKIKRIVYISCKTSTFARDAKILCDAGYTLCSVTPFDLFSHETHTECVGYFTLK